MAECIEREALITKFKKMEFGEHGLVERLFADGVYAVIAAFPAADVAPVVHARWASVPCKHDRICSRCQCDEPYKNAADDAKVFEYCPYCGAKMDGRSNDGKVL